MDRIRHEYIRGIDQIEQFGDKVRETRLSWFGHVQGRHSEYIGQSMLSVELPDRRKKGRAQRMVHGCTEGGHTDGCMLGIEVDDPR